MKKVTKSNFKSTTYFDRKIHEGWPHIKRCYRSISDRQSKLTNTLQRVQILQTVYFGQICLHCWALLKH